MNRHWVLESQGAESFALLRFQANHCFPATCMSDAADKHDQVANVAILGSTGSIGRNTLDVIVACSERLSVAALSARCQLELLMEQANRFHPKFVVAADSEQAAEFDFSRLPSGTTLLKGADALETVASEPTVDVVVAAIVGSAGLRSSWAALESGKRVALANKETLVVAGPLVRQLVNANAHRGAALLPVDSEHSAIFQALSAGNRADVKRIILTASGGPFREYSPEQLKHVTVEQALDHPTWEMGTKITIDSATMMNKALEIIEARWLFDLEPDQISIVVHPQSYIHSMVEFVDGSIVSQMSPPDMRLPIQYALSYPERWESPAVDADFSQPLTMELFPPDFEKFPALQLGLDVAKSGGTAGAVVNAANEAAVQSFVDGQMKFTEIVPACRSILENHDFDPSPSLQGLFELDSWAREEVKRWVCT